MNLHSKLFLLAAILALSTACSTSDPNESYTKHSEDSRTPKFTERDSSRHPNETLAFFEIKNDQTVVEIWPGGGWYTEILAPYLRPSGTYYAAHFDAQSNIKFFRGMRAKFNQKIASNLNTYDKVIITDFAPPHKVNIAPKETADRVLTFRNVHNWMRNSSEQAAFNSFYNALKPGGYLGVVEHRAPDSYTQKEMIETGYVSESYVKQLAENAGFIFSESSEVNSNPKDTKNHPKGVWTLPPSLRLGDKDQEKYLSIGESDRMTLKFKKPI